MGYYFKHFQHIKQLFQNVNFNISFTIYFIHPFHCLIKECRWGVRVDRSRMKSAPIKNREEKKSFRTFNSRCASLHN